MKTAIVLMQLGGPDRPAAVAPFLRNLFGDPAILDVPDFIRPFLAWLIASRRASKARAIYAQIGGKSPILENTQAQANALEALLNESPADETRCFIAMRYWHPMTAEAVRHVAEFRPDRIVLLPLYPQYSTATTASSFRAWNNLAKFEVPTKTIESYPVEPGFIAASVELLQQGMAQAGRQPVRVLFSAHGLPERVIKAGDPYQSQVEQTANAIASAMGLVDWSVCYQSRVGPLKWIGPSTDAEIERAGRDKRGVVLYPLSFVSEHSETLVELDIEYRHLATQKGVTTYIRVPTVGTHPLCIGGLANLVRSVL